MFNSGSISTAGVVDGVVDGVVVAVVFVVFLFLTFILHVS